MFDATNTTRKRRAKLYDAVVVDKGFKLFFVESVCDREDIIDRDDTSIMSTRGIEKITQFCTRFIFL